MTKLLSRFGCPIKDYDLRNYLGSKVISNMTWEAIRVDDPRPEGLREGSYPYNPDFPMEGMDWLEFLSEYSSWLDIQPDEMVPAHGELNRAQLREEISQIAEMGKEGEIFMRMYYHQALFNKQIADYQTSMLVAAENQKEVEVSRLQTQLSEMAFELSSCVGANRALEAKGATLEAKLAKAQHEANAARLCFANLREEVKSHGLPDPGHIRQ